MTFDCMHGSAAAPAAATVFCTQSAGARGNLPARLPATLPEIEQPRQQRWKIPGHRWVSHAFFGEDWRSSPQHGTCRLSSYRTTPAAVDHTAAGDAMASATIAAACSTRDGDGTCLEPCAPGFVHVARSRFCLQACPAEAVGPSQLCANSHTCVRPGSECPMLSAVLYDCPAADQLMGGCVKQTFQAQEGAPAPGRPACGANTRLSRGLDGSWHCVPSGAGAAASVCGWGFANTTGWEPGLGVHCSQMCPPWLVDCGKACHMPGVPCSSSTHVLCPLTPSTACSLERRSALALDAACRREGFRGASSCPLALQVHGSCGGTRLQVLTGLRHGGFLRSLELWNINAPVAESANSASKALAAVRVSLSDGGDTLVLGNASAAAGSPPDAVLHLAGDELIVSLRLWSSRDVMDDTLSPLLSGLSMFTSSRREWAVGEVLPEAAGPSSSSPGPAGSNAWQQRLDLSGAALGTGMPVGVAAYSSTAGVHSLGLIFLSRAARQEL